MHEYTLVRSKRKSVTIYIRPDATVEVRAPLQMSKAEIDKIVVSREDWINKKLPQMRAHTEKMAAFRLDYGDRVRVRGETIPIAARNGGKAGFDNESFFMPPDLPADHIKDICVQIYKLVAKQVLTEKTIEFAEKMGVMPTAVKITSAKTRWGSCSNRKSINFSWYLVMAEDDVIDYVVVHELAHLREMNHSARFWTIVAEMLPDYKMRQERLKLLQKKLSGEKWE